MSMRTPALFSEALISMQSTKMRCFLTALGIIIGVASVVLMLAIGQGVRNKIQDSIRSMGSNLFVVLSGASSTNGVRLSTGSAPTLKTSDAAAIAELTGVLGVAPSMPGTAQAVHAGNNWNTSVAGVTPSYLDVREWRIASGAGFTDRDVRSASRTAILGSTVVENLFTSSAEAIGAEIRIKNLPFEVVGVLETKGQSLDGRDQDDIILVPLTTAQRKLFGGQFPDSVRMIMVKAASDQVMDRLEADLHRLLRRLHRLPAGADEDFSVRNLAAIAQVAASGAQAMTLLLGAVASISLLVGGIGIMNIMLVSVTERTREIGIRKAIGASERDILMQFLIEAVLISISGGLIGVLLGTAAAAAADLLLDMTTRVSGTSVMLSFAVSAAVGVFFGYYPARQAAALKPIEALRHR